MKNSAKIAISLPLELLEKVDRDRRSSGISRSEVFRRALESQLQRDRQESDLRRYVRGYEKHPETEREIEDAAASSTAALAEEPWE